MDYVTKMASLSRSERVLKRCAWCQELFTPVRRHHKHCRPSCRRLAFESRKSTAAHARRQADSNAWRFE